MKKSKDSIKGSNPMLREKVFERAYGDDNIMTINGIVNKLFLLFFLFVLAAGLSWYAFPLVDLTTFFILTVLAFVLGIVTSFKPNISPITTPIYVLIEGICIGFFSFLLDTEYQGIVFQAVLLTLGVFIITLLVYKFRIITVNQTFVKWITITTGSIALIYLLDLILILFGVSVPFIHSNGWQGIVFSLVVVGVAALNFLSDFYFIEVAEKRQAPQYMEWYLAFGVFLTFVWLYLEILRLLSKLRSRN